LLRCALRCCAATHSAATPATRSAAQQRNAQRSVCENVPLYIMQVNAALLKNQMSISKVDIYSSYMMVCNKFANHNHYMSTVKKNYQKQRN
jgi:hypothetical protein